MQGRQIQQRKARRHPRRRLRERSYLDSVLTHVLSDATDTATTRHDSTSRDPAHVDRTQAPWETLQLSRASGDDVRETMQLGFRTISRRSVLGLGDGPVTHTRTRSNQSRRKLQDPERSGRLAQDFPVHKLYDSRRTDRLRPKLYDSRCTPVNAHDERSQDVEVTVSEDKLDTRPDGLGLWPLTDSISLASLNSDPAWLQQSISSQCRSQPPESGSESSPSHHGRMSRSGDRHTDEDSDDDAGDTQSCMICMYCFRHIAVCTACRLHHCRRCLAGCNNIARSSSHSFDSIAVEPDAPHGEFVQADEGKLTLRDNRQVFAETDCSGTACLQCEMRRHCIRQRHLFDDQSHDDSTQSMPLVGHAGADAGQPGSSTHAVARLPRLAAG